MRIRDIVFLGIGLALFSVFVYQSRIEGLSRLGELRIVPLCGIFFATLGITWCLVVRWGILTNALVGGRVAGWIDYYHYFIIVRSLGFILPKDATDLGGRAVWLSRSHDISLSQSITSVFLDRIFDILLLAVFLPAVLLYWLNWAKASVTISFMFGFCIVFAFLLFFIYKTFLSVIEWILSSGFELVQYIPWSKKKPPNLLNLTTLRRSTVLKAYFFSLAKFFFTAGRLILFAITLNLPISPSVILLGTPIGQLTYLFAFTPGGLGIFEAGWIGILKLANVETYNAMAFVVGQRVLTVITIGILALLSQAFFVARRYKLANKNNYI
jgi:uncharacterized protein (TIRG00374 family)